MPTEMARVDAMMVMLMRHLPIAPARPLVVNTYAEAALHDKAMHTADPQSAAHGQPSHAAARAARQAGAPWMAPTMGGEGTSPRACMVMTCMACAAGRLGMGTAHMLTASAHAVLLKSCAGMTHCYSRWCQGQFRMRHRTQPRKAVLPAMACIHKQRYAQKLAATVRAMQAKVRTERRGRHEQADQRQREHRHKARQVLRQHERAHRGHQRDRARHDLDQERVAQAGPHLVQQ